MLRRLWQPIPEFKSPVVTVVVSNPGACSAGSSQYLSDLRATIRLVRQELGLLQFKYENKPHPALELPALIPWDLPALMPNEYFVDVPSKL